MASHILVVEDHPDTARALAHLLRRDGFRVNVAGRLDEAVALCATECFDLLLVDLELPDGSGMALPQLVKDRCPAAAIVMSGHGGPEHRQEARDHGFADYLLKPLTWETIRSAIDRALRGASPRGTRPSRLILV